MKEDPKMDSKTNGFLNKFFELEKNKTNVKTEIIAGITTFVTVAYILAINPKVLSEPFEILGNPELATKISNGVFIGTCLGAFIGTVLVALYAKLPFAQAPGMGLSAFFAYTVTLRDRKSTRLNSSHHRISYAVFCLKKQNGLLRDRKSVV